MTTSSTHHSIYASAVSQDNDASVRPRLITDTHVSATKLALQAIANAPVAAAPFMDEDGEDGDASWGPVVVCPSVSLADLKRWLDDADEMPLRRWRFEPLHGGSTNGRLVVYSLPTFVHEETAGAIGDAIKLEVFRIGHSLLEHSVRSSKSPTCYIGDTAQEPDHSFIPISLAVGPGVRLAGNGRPFPTVVVEVAYKNESLRRLRDKLGRWMGDNTSVQVAIGIKIFARSSRRVAILHQRGQPVVERDFGAGVIAPSPLEFPLRLIYAGVSLPHDLAAFGHSMIQIDLIHLRNTIDAILAPSV